MNKIEIGLGDFLKNAGLVGFVYMLDHADARKDIDYGIEEQTIWVEKEFAETADWTSMYFNAFIEYFGPSTTYQRVWEKIEECIGKIDAGHWKTTKDEKDALAYINDKLLSNSYQSGFANIESQIENAEIYKKLKKNKLNVKLPQEELLERLKELRSFVEQPLCRETFIMKSVVYTFINRFWDGKCFLLRANAKKDMKEVFEKDFTKPFKEYLKNDHQKSKDLCIDCGSAMDPSEKVSIAFMKDMADDLTRKRSAFWAGRVDAFLCPVCAFIYALTPLGFQLYANKFVFVNNNENVSNLLILNSKSTKGQLEAVKEDGETYSTWFSRLLNIVLAEKSKELRNIQVILRGVRAEDQYMFRIIQKEILEILNDGTVKKYLEKLGKHPYTKIKNELINVHETVVLNILEYKNQYALLRLLLKESIETPGILSTAYNVYRVQLSAGIKRRGIKMDVNKESSKRIKMRNHGYELRKKFLQSKKADNDECLRGIIYQLLNALAVRNEEKYMDIVIRMYSSLKDVNMPNGFVEMLGSREQDKEKFLEYGYAFLLGLKGSHPDGTKQMIDELKKEEEK